VVTATAKAISAFAIKDGPEPAATSLCALLGADTDYVSRPVSAHALSTRTDINMAVKPHASAKTSHFLVGVRPACLRPDSVTLQLLAVLAVPFPTHGNTVSLPLLSARLAAFSTIETI